MATPEGPPGSGSAADFSAIDIAGWSRAALRSRCTALGIPLAPRVSTLRSRLLRWRREHPAPAPVLPVANAPVGAFFLPSASHRCGPVALPTDPVPFVGLDLPVEDSAVPLRSKRPLPPSAPFPPRQKPRVEPTAVRSARSRPPLAPFLPPPPCGSALVSTDTSSPSPDDGPAHSPPRSPVPAIPVGDASNAAPAPVVPADFGISAASRARLESLPARPSEAELATLCDVDLRILLSGLCLPRMNRGGKAPMVKRVVQWLEDHPNSVLPLAMGLRRRSPQAPVADAGHAPVSVNAASAGSGFQTGFTPGSVSVSVPAHTMTQPVSDFPTQPQARPQSQSQSQQMDVDAQPQAPSHSPADMQWQFMGATVSRTAPSSPQEPSVQSDPIPPRDAIRNSRPSYAEAVVNGGRSATTSLPNVQALTDIIHNAQTALNAVVQASQGTLSDTAARSTLVGLAARAEPALRVLSAAHAGLAAAQALQPPMTGPCPCAQPPSRDPVPQPELPRGASAWFQDRCIVLDPQTMRIAAGRPTSR